MQKLVMIAVLAAVTALPAAAEEVLKTRVVAATAIPAPGFASGVTLESSGSSDGVSGPILAYDGTVAFAMNLHGEGMVAGENNLALYVRKPDGTYEVIARRGDQAPGLPDGTRLSKFAPQNFSEAGKLAISGILMTGSGGVTGFNEHAGYLWVPGQGLQ